MEKAEASQLRCPPDVEGVVSSSDFIRQGIQKFRRKFCRSLVIFSTIPYLNAGAPII